MNAQKPQPRHAIATYRSVVTNNVTRQSSSETRRPTVSATTPVGISNTMEPRVNAEFVSSTCMMSRPAPILRSEEHTSELQSLAYLVCRLLLEKKKKTMSLKTYV